MFVECGLHPHRFTSPEIGARVPRKCLAWNRHRLLKADSNPPGGGWMSFSVCNRIITACTDEVARCGTCLYCCLPVWRRKAAKPPVIGVREALDLESRLRLSEGVRNSVVGLRRGKVGSRHERTTRPTGAALYLPPSGRRHRHRRLSLLWFGSKPGTERRSSTNLPPLRI